MVTSRAANACRIFSAMTDKIVVLCTCASPEDGERIARALLAGRLAACVSVAPGMRSFYHWKDGIEDSEECLLVIKSSRPLFAELSLAIEKLHAYEVPEVIALPVVEGSENYLNWLTANLRTETAE
jgi:periplasmic divalent cation tolerance protein